MPWLALLASADPTPVDQATSSVIGYVFNYGILGIVTVAFAWLFYRGWRLVPPDRETSIRDATRADARADLLEERARVLAEKTRIEAERDEALRIAGQPLDRALDRLVHPQVRQDRPPLPHYRDPGRAALYHRRRPLAPDLRAALDKIHGRSAAH